VIDVGGVTLATLAERVEHGQIVGDASTRVTGANHDSRLVAAGDLFLCLEGSRYDGHQFVDEAVRRGARAILANADRRSVIPQGVPAMLVPNTRTAMGEIAACIFGDPSADMDLIGVTGTNGKSTLVSMCVAIGTAAGIPAGRIGTLGAFALGRELPSLHTTPEADDLQRLLAQMRDMGVRLIAMEVSSHGLALHRTDGTRFSGGVFTNLTQDHLDFHRTMDEYFESKLRLFRDYPQRSCKPFVASVNVDDPRGSTVAAVTRGRVVTYGLAQAAQVRASDVRAGAARTHFTLEGLGAPVPIELPIGGSFQVSNALGAIAICHGLGIPLEAIVEGLRTMEPVPGRYESVPTGRGWDLIVDFAHTPAGLESLLASARALNPARIILVMGCGGDRDAGKRPIMGRIAAQLADVVVVTSDNPRHEDPAAIIAQIVAGMDEHHASIITEVDRRRATELAIHEARPGDLVLIAGKGGETYTIVGDEHIPYDDRIVAREILERLP
jgi:UDP-N-acetylmuramoyl-L-alanyl-D-glutamate--2,6-diaminopimelate ligase